MRERLTQAQRHVAEGEIDFAFMEYQALVRDFPEDPLAKEATFAIGEYYFKQHNTREAKSTFEKFIQEPTEGIQDLLAYVYLLQCARFSEHITSAKLLEHRLKEMFSTTEVFLAFEENRTKEWISPLGNRFQLREFVDRMEITLNDTPFYTINLP
ncbi:MAG: hypothetical protein HY590_05655 [Candidatus Omnitrophica bacterium]|nr:hypothetical protein [Candidatus Omnitrophota bacterium]